MILKSFLFVFCLLASYAPAQHQKNIPAERIIYIINYSWHTGFVIPVDSSLAANMPVIKNFNGYKYIDIGWGDRDFYQLEEFKLYEGLKALLVPTPAALRFEGYTLTIEETAKYVDRVNEIKLDEEKYKRLIGFINSYLKRGKYGEFNLLSEKSEVRIIFFAAEGSYHLYNTCNTWIAKGLKQCGFNINLGNVSTEEDIFRELSALSRKLK